MPTESTAEAIDRRSTRAAWRTRRDRSTRPLASARDDDGRVRVDARPLPIRSGGHRRAAGRRPGARRLRGDGAWATSTGLRERLEEDPARSAAYSPDGFTALHFAAFFGKVEAARILLEDGADGRRLHPQRVRQPAAPRRGRRSPHRGLPGPPRRRCRRQRDPARRVHAAPRGGQHGDVELAELFLSAGADPTIAAAGRPDRRRHRRGGRPCRPGAAPARGGGPELTRAGGSTTRPRASRSARSASRPARMPRRPRRRLRQRPAARPTRHPPRASGTVCERLRADVGAARLRACGPAARSLRRRPRPRRSAGARPGPRRPRCRCRQVIHELRLAAGDVEQLVEDVRGRGSSSRTSPARRTAHSRRPRRDGTGIGWLKPLSCRSPAGSASTSGSADGERPGATRISPGPASPLRRAAWMITLPTAP